MTRSTQRSMCAAILTLEAVVVGLTTPVMISVADVGATTALWVGPGLAVACLVTAGLLRRRWAYLLGSCLQVAAIALGVVVTIMYLLGVVFAALWVTAYLLGRTVDRDRSRAEQPAHPR